MSLEKPMIPIFKDDRDDNLMTGLAALSIQIDALLQSDRSHNAIESVLQQLWAIAQIYSPPSP
jgi:hypothetical protein